MPATTAAPSCARCRLRAWSSTMRSSSFFEYCHGCCRVIESAGALRDATTSQQRRGGGVSTNSPFVRRSVGVARAEAAGLRQIAFIAASSTFSTTAITATSSIRQTGERNAVAANSTDAILLMMNMLLLLLLLCGRSRSQSRWCCRCGRRFVGWDRATEMAAAKEDRNTKVKQIGSAFLLAICRNCRWTVPRPGPAEG